METKQSAEEKELEREERQLRDEAEALDPVRPEDTQLFDDANPADARAAARESHPSPKGDRPGGDKKPDVTDTTKTDASKANDRADPTNPPPKAPDAKPASEATPFQKERARLSESWKKLEAEKEAVRQEREQLTTLRRASEPPQRQSPAATPDRKPQIDGGDAETWAQIAREFEAEGNMPLAQKAKDNAEKLRKQEQAPAAADAAPRERFTPQEVQTMQIEWQGHLQRLTKEHPELLEETSPLRKRVAEILQHNPVLHNSGDGIVTAVAYARAEMKAAQLETLQTKLAELEQEKKRLESLTALPTGGTTPRTGTRKFDELTLDEQETVLREEAAA